MAKANLFEVENLTTITRVALVHSIPSWLVWAKIEWVVHHFKPVQQSIQQAIRDYGPL